MAYLHRSLARLRISGESLLPDEITALLGAKPSRARVKGEPINSRVSNPVLAKIGSCQLAATECEPENVDGQVQEILSQLTDDLSVWTDLGARFGVDLFCGWFMQETNEGLSLSPWTLADLGQRGIVLALDIYAPREDE